MSSCASLPVEIYDARIDGNAVTFKCKSLDGDRVIWFTGVINGDEIEFTWEKYIQDGGVPPAAADASALFGASIVHASERSAFQPTAVWSWRLQ